MINYDLVLDSLKELIEQVQREEQHNSPEFIDFLDKVEDIVFKDYSRTIITTLPEWLGESEQERIDKWLNYKNQGITIQGEYKQPTLDI